MSSETSYSFHIATPLGPGDCQWRRWCTSFPVVAGGSPTGQTKLISPMALCPMQSESFVPLLTRSTRALAAEPYATAHSEGVAPLVGVGGGITGVVSPPRVGVR